MKKFLASLIALSTCALGGVANAQQSPDPSANDVEREVRVHIKTDGDPARLRRKIGRFGRVVCDAPCGEVVRFKSKDKFVVEGPFPELSSFHFDERATEFVIEVKEGSWLRHNGGLVLLATGSTVLTISGVLAIVYGLAPPPDLSQAENDELLRVVYPAMGVGGLFMGLGLWALSDYTSEMSIYPVDGPGKTPVGGFAF